MEEIKNPERLYLFISETHNLVINIKKAKIESIYVERLFS